MTAIPTPQAAPAAAERIPVWDLPTRLFHWALVGLVLLNWFTGEEEAAALIHRVSGEVIAGLIIFRVVWGFVGGEHARFADFVKGPRAVGRHVSQLLRGRAEPSIGHNPLGGLGVLLLLAATSFVVVTGLFSAGDDGPGGPFAGRFGWELSDLHEPAFRILQAVVAIHLLGVAVTSLASRDNLVLAMITGFKRRTAETAVRSTQSAPAMALLIALAIGAAVSAYLIRLPHPTAGAERGGEHRMQSDAGEEDAHGDD